MIQFKEMIRNIETSEIFFSLHITLVCGEVKLLGIHNTCDYQ